ncbi:DUF4214 domain-containing protein [Pseudoduganella namucuonensis]|uniref:DUF4214 domain-containing protein n=1 Tax=Pseudoduganella namucuonensis TaxID=1035707 RepID=A0A1I7EUI3_9BURK|nr:DUF4214 domain-containing protein [Pseudoduganella namucuonensis]SFU27585.1 protein of unknown function [Pseudoduganella namucuonensis]
MANIDIKLSQSIVSSGLLPDWDLQDGMLADLVDAMTIAASTFPDRFSQDATWSFDGATARLSFPDGSYQQFTGVSLADPTSLRGTATATGMQLSVPGAASVVETGRYSFSYEIVNNQLFVRGTASTVTSAKIQTLLSTSSPDYDQTLGNVGVELRGQLNVDASGNLDGTVAAITLAADKFIASASLTGSFHVSGNAVSIGDGDGHMAVDGTLAGLDAVFQDGSHASISGIAAAVGAGADLGAGLLTDPALLGGNDTIRVELPASLQGSLTIASGAGNDAVAVGGGRGQLNVDAGAGNDIITVLSGSHDVDGGAGLDTLVYSGGRQQYTVASSDQGRVITGSSGSDLASNVERVKFADGMLAFDLDGGAGQAYRLYQAAFDRAPDAAGLGYWIDAMDRQVSLRDVAQSFINSGEFAQLYGANPTTEAFVSRLYSNVLHRAPDQAGYDYWVDAMHGGASKADVLASFSEGGENRAQVIGIIQDGIAYTLVG